MGQSSLKSLASGSQSRPFAVFGMVGTGGVVKSLDAADAWIRFVEARDRYRGMSANPMTDPLALAAAREAMQEAYLSWSSH